MNRMEKTSQYLMDKLTNELTWIMIGQGLLKIVAIILISGIIVRIGKIAIRNVFLVRQRSPLRVSERRDATLLRLLQNILTYAVYFIAIIMVLSILGIQIGPIIASAGIVGLAVGFGAQSLVKDIITGFFIIFEDQFAVGDYIRIGQFEGVVEVIGLRTTKIKNWTGEVHIIPNGTITQVTNFSLNNSIAIVDISVSFDVDIHRVEQIIEDFLKTLPEKYEEIVQPPELLGVQNFGASEIVLRVTAETVPLKHLFIARQLRKEIKLLLDEYGIKLPYPRVVMFSQDINDLNKKEVGS